MTSRIEPVTVCVSVNVVRTQLVHWRTNVSITCRQTLHDVALAVWSAPGHGLPWRATDGSGGFSPVSGPGAAAPARRTRARSGLLQLLDLNRIVSLA